MSNVKIITNEDGISLRHSDRFGGTHEYLTPLTSEEEAEAFIKEVKLDNLVSLAEMNSLTQEAYTRVVAGNMKNLREVVGEWLEEIRLVLEPTTVDNYRKVVDKWVNDALTWEMTPREIEVHHVHDYINHREYPMKRNTRKIYLAGIRSFFSHCSHKGYVLTDPSRAPAARVRMRGLSHEEKEAKDVPPIGTKEVALLTNYLDKEEAAFVQQLKNLDYEDNRYRTRQATLNSKLDMVRFWRAAVLLSHHTALRCSDVVALEWASINNLKGTLVVWTEKRDKRVEFPLTGKLAKAVSKIDMTDLTYCFPEQREWAPAKVSTYFKRLCKRAGVVGSFHGIRHGTLQEWKDQGVTLQELAKRAGHSSTSTTEGYL